MINCQLVVWSTGQMVEWKIIVSWSTAQQVNWSTGYWLTGRLVGWLAGLGGWVAGLGWLVKKRDVPFKRDMPFNLCTLPRKMDIAVRHSV